MPLRFMWAPEASTSTVTIIIAIIITGTVTGTIAVSLSTIAGTVLVNASPFAGAFATDVRALFLLRPSGSAGARRVSRDFRAPGGCAFVVRN